MLVGDNADGKSRIMEAVSLLNHTLELAEWASERFIPFGDTGRGAVRDVTGHLRRERLAESMRSWLAEGDRLLGGSVSGPNLTLRGLDLELVIEAKNSYIAGTLIDGQHRLGALSKPSGIEVAAQSFLLQRTGRLNRHSESGPVEFNALQMERAAAKYRALRALPLSVFGTHDWAQAAHLPDSGTEVSQPWSLACGVFRLTVPLVPRAPGRVPPGLNMAWWDVAGVPSGGTKAA